MSAASLTGTTRQEGCEVCDRSSAAVAYRRSPSGAGLQDVELVLVDGEVCGFAVVMPLDLPSWLVFLR